TVVEQPQSLKDQCLELNILDLEEYVSTFKFENVSTIDSMIAGFEFPMTTLPFGFLRSDWTRLLLLRNALEKNSILAEKLEFLCKILIVAYQKYEQSLVPKKFFNGTNSRKKNITNSHFILKNILNRENICRVSKDTVGKKFTKSNFNSEIVKSRIPYDHKKVNIIADNRGDINENEINENIEKEGNVEYVSMEYNTNVKENNSHTNLQRLTKTDCLENTIKSSSTVHVNKLLTNTETSNGRNDRITNVNIRNESNNKKVITIPLSIYLMISSDGANIEVPMSTNKVLKMNNNSTNTIKSDYAETSTEGLNSIDCSLSTVRTDILEETVSQKTQTESNLNNMIHSNGLDEIGYRNIKENRGMNFTINKTNPNDLKKEDNFDDSFSTNVDKNSTSSNVNTKLIMSADSGQFKIVGIVNSIKKSIDKKNPMQSSIKKVTSYKDNVGTSISPILKSDDDNLTNLSKVTKTNSMNYLNPSTKNTIYDAFTQKTDFSIDRFHHKVGGGKLKKLPVFREPPPGHVTKDHKANVELSPLVSKTITFLTDSITETNRFKEHPSNPLIPDRINNLNIDKYFRSFYNYGGRRPSKKIRYEKYIFV
ncbi:hypothetical protein M0802_008626, partial [Mischocyttarus mexicanus]